MDDTAQLKLSENEYDFGIFHPAMRRLFDGCDFYNFGFWTDAAGRPVATLREAAARMVERHIEADSHPDGVARVLDVGCGLGACSRAFAGFYPTARVTGLNYSARQVAFAREAHGGGRVDFVQGDACALDFPDDHFDRIHSIEAAMHFRPRRTFLREALRVLAPGGQMVLTDILADAPMTIMPADNVLPTIAAYTELLAGIGFTRIELTSIRDQTVTPFARVLAANAMQASARSIEATFKDYLLVSAHKPG